MVSFCTQTACKDTIFFGHMQVLWRKLNSGMWFLTVLGRKNTRFFARSFLGFKEFLFHYVRTIIPMFALQTRAAHLLLDYPPDTLRCALTASQLSLGGTQNKERHPSDASPYYIHTCMRTITTLFQACGGRICNATGRYKSYLRMLGTAW